MCVCVCVSLILQLTAFNTSVAWWYVILMNTWFMLVYFMRVYTVFNLKRTSQFHTQSHIHTHLKSILNSLILKSQWHINCCTSPHKYIGVRRRGVKSWVHVIVELLKSLRKISNSHTGTSVVESFGTYKGCESGCHWRYYTGERHRHVYEPHSQSGNKITPDVAQGSDI